MSDLPPFGLRVIVTRHNGAEVQAFRRRMPRGGWTWATDRRNLGMFLVLSWEPAPFTRQEATR